MLTGGRAVVDFGLVTVDVARSVDVTVDSDSVVVLFWMLASFLSRGSDDVGVGGGLVVSSTVVVPIVCDSVVVVEEVVVVAGGVGVVSDISSSGTHEI